MTAQDASRKLRDEGVLEHDDAGWRLVDPLLARWIRQEFPARSQL